MTRQRWPGARPLTRKLSGASRRPFHVNLDAMVDRLTPPDDPRTEVASLTHLVTSGQISLGELQALCLVPPACRRVLRRAWGLPGHPERLSLARIYRFRRRVWWLIRQRLANGQAHTSLRA